jgi:hypothetical protein
MTDVQTIAEALTDTLSEISQTFAQDELAYLALTSKAELPVRDRIAWRLQLALGEKYVVSREWRRADIAILRGDVPVIQIEAKALYAFDVLSDRSRTRFIQRLAADGLKMAALVPEGTAFLLALITHIDGAIEPHLQSHVVKYSSGIRGAVAAKGGDAGLVRSSARTYWEAELDRFHAPWQRFEIEAGRHWGMHVDIDAYLVGPLSIE